MFQTDFNALLTFKLRKIWFKYPQLGIHFHLILCLEKTDYEYSAATTNCFFRPRDYWFEFGNGQGSGDCHVKSNAGWKQGDETQIG
jgi:hypothetical protein